MNKLQMQSFRGPDEEVSHRIEMKVDSAGLRIHPEFARIGEGA